ncbi:amidase domain-containing protein [Petrocella sp. FN5]|uniref:amidase domain-containing protein n=1 Tax=Petrocella sp. FN5 TaxID=3032002 RepID=UPI0023D9DF65|nr:amidase domain-containing protein [Petrocella sp. FN5]MDF1618628.1 amidase domain-containing protein [Petrocella sp. FN5]
MKKILMNSITLFLCIFIISQTSYASSSIVETPSINETSIEKLIFDYFDVQFESVMNKDTTLSKRLENIINTKSTSGKAIYDYEIGKIEYLIASHKLDATDLESYDIEVEIQSIEEEKEKLTLEVEMKSSIKYNFLDKPSQSIEKHLIRLSLINNKWTIDVDDYETEFLLAFPIDTDFKELINNLNTEYIQYIQTVEDSKKNPVNVDRSTRGAYDPFTSTERGAGAAYALWYSEDTGDNTTDSYNNSQFKSYGSNDCQNFVSQCIWWGMGGRSSSSKDYPMTSVWWANTSGETSTWNWTGTSYFKSWVQGSNNSNIDGVDYSYPTYIEKCDYIYVPGHVMIVSNIVDLDSDGYADWNEIQICAHTSNRNDHNLKALYGGISSPPSNMDFMKIYGKYN